MNKTKRHAGRAIRKTRRQQRDMFASFHVAANLLGTLSNALNTMAREIGAAVDAFKIAAVEAFKIAAEHESQQYRMTHRALTTGKDTNEH